MKTARKSSATSKKVAARKKSGPRPVAQNKIAAFGLDALCAKLADGETMTAVAESIGVSLGTLLMWVDANPERSARTREARRQAAKLWDEKAERGIAEATDPFQLSRAKELAHHYRWRAAKVAPKEYGEKLALGGADDLPPMRTADMTDAERAVRLAAILRGAS